MMNFDIQIENRVGSYFTGKLLINGEVVGTIVLNNNGLTITLNQKTPLWKITELLDFITDFDNELSYVETTIEYDIN